LPLLLNQRETGTQQSDSTTSHLHWYFVFFVVSGFCGLVYEVVWLRLAMASFGVTTALVSIVISMFMAGLGLGSWAAGVLTRGVLQADGPRALHFYSIAELLVGISSLAVPLQLKLGRLFLQHLGSVAAWQTSRYYVLAGFWVAITLIPWCVCMGSTFPLLMAVIRQTARPDSERSFSYLYVANVLGALAGTIASAFFLIELLGFQGTLLVAGTLNLVLALSAFALSFRTGCPGGIRHLLSAHAPSSKLYGFQGRAVLLLLLTTGLVSMGMEVVWIRQFTPYLGNVVYAFAGILAVYLLATVIGSHDYRTWICSHEPSESRSSWSLLALFTVVPVFAADPLVHVRIAGIELGVLRLASIMLFCALAGFLTPLLVDAWSSGDPDRAGTAYAVNVAGCIVGPIIAGFFLLPWLGERRAATVLALPLFAVAAVTAFRRASPDEPQARFSPKLKFAVAAVGGILLFHFSHDYENLYRVREVRRDYTATVLATGRGFDRALLVNGIGMTALSPVTKYMAHLPLAFRSAPPKNGLVICFGMGTTFRSMMSWGIPTTAVDLVPSVPALFGYYHADAPKLLSSPLAHIIIDDGRRFLDGSNQVFDVIVVDPPPPPAAPGSSLLYSRDFYAVVKKHLSRDGILQVWYPTEDGDPATTASITKALMQSFRYVRAFRSYDGAYGIHFLAGMQPLPGASASELAARLPSAAASDFIEWGPQSNTQGQFQVVLSNELSLDQLLAGDPRVPAVRDDQPINEYYLLRRWFHSYR
jgi:spermidine synthase